MTEPSATSAASQVPAVAITAHDNPLLKDLRRLAHDNTAYRKQGRVWLEGDHLCRAALARGEKPALAIFSESNWPSSQENIARAAPKNIVISDRFFKEISGLESPADFGFVLDLPKAQSIQPQAMSIVLDRVQDAGNVGSILRSAAAFGFRQVLALKGTAALWSPKVLRAGMGAHFGLQLLEGLELADLDQLSIPFIATSSHNGKLIQEQEFPALFAWVLGHEGQGVRAELLGRADLTVRIGQPGGEESLNVAAAAAICLHASSVSKARKL
jgi:RNA methyltransferase, TrmH family